MGPEKVGRLRKVILAAAVCIGLGALVALVPMYPCGYWGTGELYAEGGYAGYGYHSLWDVLGRGFFWIEDSVPVPYEDFDGDAPYYVVGKWAISLLYVPIYAAILYLGIVAGEQVERRMKRTIP